MTQWCRISRKFQIVLFSVQILGLIYCTQRFYYQQPTGKQTSSPIELTKFIKSKKCNVTDCRKSIIEDINKQLSEALKQDKGNGCQRPKMDPFDKEVTQFDEVRPKIVCEGIDWVTCEFSQCKVRKSILEKHKNIFCEYQELIYDTDQKSHYGKAVELFGESAHTLTESDHAKVICFDKNFSINRNRSSSHWAGYVTGFRKVTPRKSSPPGREKTLNVLFFAFDSTSKNGFIRRMPLSNKVLLDEMHAVVLDGYNIVGDGTTAALFPILTGKTELELPDARKSKTNQHLDNFPFIFYKLKEDGYRTAYFEDCAWGGTFQYRHNGWQNQPTDHSLRHLFLRNFKNGKTYKQNLGKPVAYCIGDTPTYALLMNLTTDFFKLVGKKYCFTFVSDISHDDFNMIQTADEDFVTFLRKFKKDGRLEDTLLVVMGDHGPRYAKIRSTFLGKLEERNPLMAIILPEKLKRLRPRALESLKSNMQVLTTPHDIYATVLDVMDMRDKWNLDKVPGADLTRGLTLLEPIPTTRSCSEAGIAPHWCACVKWEHLSHTDIMYNKTANIVVDYINSLIQHKSCCLAKVSLYGKGILVMDERNTLKISLSCMLRYVISIDYVMKQRANSRLLKFSKNKDRDGFIGNFDMETKINRDEYTVKLVLGPGNGVYEASVSHIKNENTYKINTRDIQRTNAYGDEPSCISERHPHLNMFCYCKDYYEKYN